MITQVWSCGGGTQSAAVAALIIQGRLPKPDLAVIVDTEREKSSTWRYLDDVIRPNLAKVGLAVERVPKSRFATVDLYGGKDGDTLLIPAFTTQNGSVGKMETFCSVEWKREVTARWLRSLGVEQARVWIGISRDEMRRIRSPRRQWLQEWYPLLFDAPMTKGDWHSSCNGCNGLAETSAFRLLDVPEHDR